MYYRLLFIIPVFFAISCTSIDLEFVPSGDKLSAGKLGEYYEQYIFIGNNLEENPEFLTNKNTEVKIHPAGSGLKVVANHKRNDGFFVYNKIILKGIPQVAGQYYIDISGYTYGTIYTKSIHFKKTYSLKIH